MANSEHQINLIHDPSTAQQGVTVKNTTLETEARPSFPLFSDDPFLNKEKTPQLPLLIQSKSFKLALNSEWELDGHRSFVHNNNDFFIDKVIPSNFSNPELLLSTDRNTQIKFNPNAKEFYRDTSTNRKAIEISGECGVAVSTEPSNWGSFLARVLPKAISLDINGCPRLLVYCHSQRQKEMLDLVGIPSSKIIPQDVNCTYRFDKGILLSEPTIDLFINSNTRTTLQIIARRFQKHEPTQKIYISRNSEMGRKNGRYCINEEEVEKELEKIGFKIVYPELLTLEEQICIFSEAEFIVGCSGAGMFNSVFSRPGTKLIEIESQKNWFWGHMNLFSSLGLEFGFVWGRPIGENKPPHQPFEVNISNLKSHILQMI